MLRARDNINLRFSLDSIGAQLADVYRDALV